MTNTQVPLPVESFLPSSSTHVSCACEAALIRSAAPRVKPRKWPPIPEGVGRNRFSDALRASCRSQSTLHRRVAPSKSRHAKTKCIQVQHILPSYFRSLTQVAPRRLPRVTTKIPPEPELDVTRTCFPSGKKLGQRKLASSFPGQESLPPFHLKPELDKARYARTKRRSSRSRSPCSSVD